MVIIKALAQFEFRELSTFEALLQRWNYNNDVKDNINRRSSVGKINSRWIHKNEKRGEYLNKDLQATAKHSFAPSSNVRETKHQPPKDPNMHYCGIAKKVTNTGLKSPRNNSTHNLNHISSIINTKRINSGIENPVRPSKLSDSTIDGFDLGTSSNIKVDNKPGLTKSVEGYEAVSKSYRYTKEDKGLMERSSHRDSTESQDSNKEHASILFSRNLIEPKETISQFTGHTEKQNIKSEGTGKMLDETEPRSEVKEQTNFDMVLNRWKSVEQGMRDQEALQKASPRLSPINSSDLISSENKPPSQSTKSDPKDRKIYFEKLRNRMRLWEIKRERSSKIEKMSEVKPFSLNSNLMESLYRSNISEYDEMKDVDKFVYPSFNTNTEKYGINNSLETNREAQINLEFSISSPNNINDTHPSVSINDKGKNSFVTFQDNHSTDEMFACELFPNDSNINTENETKAESYPGSEESHCNTGTTMSSAKTSEFVKKGNSFCSLAWKKILPVRTGDDCGVNNCGYGTEPYKELLDNVIDTNKTDDQNFNIAMRYPETYSSNNGTQPEENGLGLLKPAPNNIFDLKGIDEKTDEWASFYNTGESTQDHRSSNYTHHVNGSSAFEGASPDNQPSQIKSKIRKLYFLPNPKYKKETLDSYQTQKVSNDAPRTEMFKIPVRWLSGVSSDSSIFKNFDEPVQSLSNARLTYLFPLVSRPLGVSHQKNLLQKTLKNFKADFAIRNFSSKPLPVNLRCFQVSTRKTIVSSESHEFTKVDGYNPVSRPVWTETSKHDLNHTNNLYAPKLKNNTVKGIIVNVTENRDTILNHLWCRPNYNAVQNHEKSSNSPKPNSKSNLKAPLIFATSNKPPSKHNLRGEKAKESGVPIPRSEPTIADSLDLKLMDHKKRTGSQHSLFTNDTDSKSATKVTQKKTEDADSSTRKSPNLDQSKFLSLSIDQKRKLNLINSKNLGNIDLKHEFFNRENDSRKSVLRPRKENYTDSPTKFEGIHPESIKITSTPIRPYKPPVDDTANLSYLLVDLKSKIN